MSRFRHPERSRRISRRHFFRRRDSAMRALSEHHGAKKCVARSFRNAPRRLVSLRLALRASAHRLHIVPPDATRPRRRATGSEFVSELGIMKDDVYYRPPLQARGENLPLWGRCNSRAFIWSSGLQRSARRLRPAGVTSTPGLQLDPSGAAAIRGELRPGVTIMPLTAGLPAAIDESPAARLLPTCASASPRSRPSSLETASMADAFEHASSVQASLSASSYVFDASLRCAPEISEGCSQAGTSALPGPSRRSG